MTDAVEAFVAHGLGARWADLPAGAREAVKTFLLDTLGVGIAGAAAPIAAPVRTAARRWAYGGAAPVLGSGGWTTTPANAAFVNGFQIHCQEFDCVHERAVVHPLATLLAALLAASAERPVDGPTFGVALAVGVDLSAGLGVAVTSPIRFFRPATAGVFGASLAVARLRGLGAEATRNALAYALSFASGTMQAHAEGKPALPVQIGNAARAAITACDLAELGMDGPRAVLEGPYGYLPLFETTFDLAPVLSNLGRAWRIAEVSHKPFPTGRAAQGGIALMRDLLGSGVSPERVTEIVLTAPPLIERLVGRPWVLGSPANLARLSFPYCGAVALLRGRVGLEDFTDAALADPQVAGLAARIRVVSDASTDPAAFTPQSVRARLADGREITARLDALPGSPARPLTAAENRAKFEACVRFGFPDAPSVARIADRLAAAVEGLDSVTDAGVFGRLGAGLEE